MDINRDGRIALVIIGDEILNGKISDKNISTLAVFLQKNNKKLSEVHVISDDSAVICERIKSLSISNELIIVSGGLGPTPDDLTKDSIAQAAGTKVSHSPNAESIAKKNYQRRNINFDPKTNSYVLFPEGMEPLNNPVGLAPGIWWQTDKFSLAALPGVPDEFNKMIETEVWPRFLEISGKDERILERVNIRTKLIPEEKIFGSLCPNLWDELSKYGQVSSYPQINGVDICINISGTNEQELKFKRESILKFIDKTDIPQYVWQIGEEPLEALIIKEANKKNLTIATAESCTGGLIASRLTDIPGSSDVFKGTVVSYSNEIKSKLLNVQQEAIKKYGAVSTQTAEQMANGAFTNLSVDIAVSTSGIAGPGGGSPDKPVGTVAIAIVSKNGIRSKIYKFNGNRTKLKLRFSEMALFDLLEEINSV